MRRSQDTRFAFVIGITREQVRVKVCFSNANPWISLPEGNIATLCFLITSQFPTSGYRLERAVSWSQTAVTLVVANYSAGGAVSSLSDNKGCAVTC